MVEGIAFVTHGSFSLIWWITAVELPVLASLFWLIWHGRREHDRAMHRVHAEIQGHLAALLDNLTQFKLEVARAYVTTTQLKDLEKRLTQHLLRLEDRIVHLNAVAADGRRRLEVVEGVAARRREGGHGL